MLLDDFKSVIAYVKYLWQLFENILIKGNIEKVPRGIQGEKSSKDTASSGNLVSTIEAYASPKKGDRTWCPEGLALPADMSHL